VGTIQNQLTEGVPMSVQIQEATDFALPPAVIEGEAHLFQENFDRFTFQFAHHLAGHPLFELPRLLELSRTLPDADVYYDAGQIRVDQRWDQVPRTQLTVDQLIERIENAGAWILLKRTNQDPRYAAVLNQTLAEAAALVGPRFPKNIRMRTNVILVTSPNRVTSYHIDPDCNFLCQIQGEKVLYVFDRYDRDVIPEEELERFWAVDKNAAVYKEQYQNRATTYQLKPGMAVHIPVNAPHWAQNANNVSVSLAMSFQFLESELANVYRCNHYLRKLGVRPLPPGRSKARDALKSWTLSGAIAFRSALGQIAGRKRYVTTREG
jgi:hypothetical protein